MPKKTRKMKQRAAMRRSVPSAGAPSQAEETPAGVTPSKPILAPSTRTVTPINYDYSHIYNDLKRIALFASFFFAVLIVLSFIIK